MGRSLYVTCPHCQGLMEVDSESGTILKKWAPSEQSQPGEDKMSSALKKLEENKKKRVGLFDKTKEELEIQKKKIEQSFRNEVEKVKKEGISEKPISPFDLD